MIVVLQRVQQASVSVEGRTVGAIGRGVLLLACALPKDAEPDVVWLADKITDLRIFADEHGRSERSLLEVGGAALVVSQFTLAADWRKGRRPSFGAAAEPARGAALLARLAARLAERGVPVAEGRFGAEMCVALVNEGPYTLVLDSARRAGASCQGTDGPGVLP